KQRKPRKHHRQAKVVGALLLGFLCFLCVFAPWREIFFGHFCPGTRKTNTVPLEGMTAVWAGPPLPRCRDRIQQSTPPRQGRGIPMRLRSVVRSRYFPAKSVRRSRSHPTNHA